MDGQRFDDLARAIAATVNRRQLLRTLGGGAAGAALALVGLGRSGAASCRDAGRMCNGNGDCCSGLCDTTNPDPFKRNRCACPPGTVNCRGACLAATAEFLSDVNNCGGCGNRCPIDQCNRAICVQGQCDLEPNPDRVGKSCDDGDRCTVGDVCLADGSCAGTPVVCTPQSQCHSAACNPDTGACVQTPLTGTTCETGNLCTTDTCQAGVCVSGPPVADETSCGGPGQSCCGGVCVDTSSDESHCGGCRIRCTAGQVCTSGDCPVDLELFGTNFFVGTLDVDDDLTVYLNGTAIFVDNDGQASANPPIAFSARNGDGLRLVAADTSFDGAATCHYLDPFALRRVSDGAVQFLDDGVAEVCTGEPPVGVFYDQSFTIALP